MGPEDLDIAVDESYDTYRDEDEDDDDVDRMTFTSQSVASNVTQYRYENGRRYHAFREGTYYGPNDDKAAHVETIAHHLWLLTLNDQLFLAPIEDPQMILDIGTGTGLWAIDMADYFPSAEIIASTAPPNIRFEVDDACAEWTYPESSFDFVHARALTGCIKDWPYMYQQCFRHLKPGGYFEHLEFSCMTSADPNSDAYADKMYTQLTNAIIMVGEEKTGQTFLTMQRMEEYMRGANFVDIVEKKGIWPIGPWPSDPHLKNLGRWGERYWLDGLEGWILAIYTRSLGWTYAEVQAFISELKAIVKDRKNHYYIEVRCLYGRKPFPDEEQKKKDELNKHSDPAITTEKHPEAEGGQTSGSS